MSCTHKQPNTIESSVSYVIFARLEVTVAML